MTSALEKFCSILSKGESLEEARKYYYVTTDLSQVPVLKKMDDKDLYDVLSQDDTRQMLHITYGLILTAKDSNGKYLLRDKFFDTLHQYEDDYCEALEQHIGKHISLLKA